MQAAVPEAKQSARSEQTRFELALHECDFAHLKETDQGLCVCEHLVCLHELVHN